jgi:hypothetical protein
VGIYGQDWSSYQESEPSVEGLDFVFTKITEGLSYENPKWVAQRDHAKANGLLWGAYHYPHMGNSVQAEADYFLSRVNWQPGDIIILDWEGYDAANKGLPHSVQETYRDSWLKYVKSRLPQHKVGIYCNTDYWRNVDTRSNCGDFLWIATADRKAGDPGIEHDWMFHQYSDNPVDKDYCRLGSRVELAEWAGAAGYVVNLDRLVEAAHTDPGAEQGHQTAASDVLTVEQALAAEGLLDASYAGDGSFGSLTLDAYSRWQQRIGYTGTQPGGDADGIPGRASLTALGERHGFTVA